jgi:hypothetical protein
MRLKADKVTYGINRAGQGVTYSHMDDDDGKNGITIINLKDVDVEYVNGGINVYKADKLEVNFILIGNISLWEPGLFNRLFGGGKGASVSCWCTRYETAFSIDFAKEISKEAIEATRNFMYSLTLDGQYAKNGRNLWMLRK